MPIELVIEGIARRGCAGGSRDRRLGGGGLRGAAAPQAAGGEQENDSNTEAKNGFLHGLNSL